MTINDGDGLTAGHERIRLTMEDLKAVSEALQQATATGEHVTVALSDGRMFSVRTEGDGYRTNFVIPD